MARQITLSRGLVALVDDADYERVSAICWCAKPASQSDAKYYGYRSRRGSKPLYLHRYILEAPDHLLVDHINGDTLDNRRANLRLCTSRQNAIHRAYANPTGFRGVQQNGAGFRVLFSSEGRSSAWPRSRRPL